jgi:hypothetical protein
MWSGSLRSHRSIGGIHRDEVSAAQEGNNGGADHSPSSTRRTGGRGILNRLTSVRNRAARAAVPGNNMLDFLQTIRPSRTPQAQGAYLYQVNHSHNDDPIVSATDVDMPDADAEVVSVSTNGSTISSMGSSSHGSVCTPYEAGQIKSSFRAPLLGMLPQDLLSNQRVDPILPDLSSVFEDCSVTLPSQSSQSPPRTVKKRPRCPSPSLLYKAVSKGARHSDVKIILDHDPAGVFSQPDGSMTPLHVAIERYDTPINTLLMLLQSNPGAAGVRFNGQNAVDLLWMRFVTPADYRSKSIKDRAAQLYRCLEDVTTCFSLNSEARAHHALAHYADLRGFWNTMSSFIYAAVHKCVGVYMAHSDSHRIVHDTILLDCDPLLIRLAVALYPQQVRERNHAGHLALHMAAMHCSPVTLLTVLQLNPQAASRTDRLGKLALHLAIEAGVTWHGGLLALIEANPRSLSAPCPTTGLLPCMLAACQNDYNVTTIYSLLLENPVEICRYALNQY